VLLLNSKGQESATFELLVVAIMGLAIMLIVLGIADYFSGLRFQASERAFNDSFNSAVNMPNGEIITAPKVYLNEGDKTTASLSKQSSIPAECIQIEAVNLPAFKLEGNERIQILKAVEANVYFRCILSSLYGIRDCEESCLVSFGKEITP
jgi:hypothetical protein